jgi:CheY-like chemotaxis protein
VSEADKRRPVILVVEDDHNTQILLSYMLRQNYDVHFAATVDEAKQLLENKTVDLILLDLSLKGDEDGLDLTRYLRQSEQWREVPIIAATAHAFTHDRDNCLAAGCNDYLAKPIRREDLLAKIKEYL